MSRRLSDQLAKAREHLQHLEDEAKTKRTLAATLVADSFRQHVLELEREVALIEDNRSVEMMEWRLISPSFEQGAILLNVLSDLTRELWHLLGHVANVASSSGKTPDRVPSDIFSRLDARLAAILPGSTRLVITTAANRDLFDYGLSKEAIRRVFRTLETGGKGTEFEEAAAALGAQGAQHMKELMRLIGKDEGSAEVTWRYSGGVAGKWTGDNPTISALENALAAGDIRPRQTMLVSGTIEYLNVNSRLGMLLDNDKRARISFPPSLLAAVTTLHVKQQVTLRCGVTDFVAFGNTRTTRAYELIDIVQAGDIVLGDKGASD